MRVVVLIPTYNEKENIERLLKELIERTSKLGKYDFTILIADDNSPDGTGDIAKKYSKKHRNIVLLSHKKEGLGRAMVRAYNHAMKKLKADVVVTNEADFGFSFKHLPMMLGKIDEGYDVVVASRHVGLGGSEGWTLTRKLNHWVANTFFGRYVAGVTQVNDRNGAMRAVRVKGVLDSIGLSKMDVAGFGFFFLSIYKLTQVTDKFYEFPSTFRFRMAGESKVSFNTKYLRVYARDVLEYAKIAFQIRFHRV